MTRLLIAICFLWACCAIRLGAEEPKVPTDVPKKETVTPEKEIGKWIEMLYDEDPSQRRTATDKLIHAGKNAVMAVKKASKSKNAEVRYRAALILVEIDKSMLKLRKDLVRQFNGGPKVSGEEVIRTEKAWAAWITRCTTASIRNELRKMKVDFDRNQILAVAQGPSRSALTKGEKKKAGIRKISPGLHRWTVEVIHVTSDKVHAEPEYPFFLVQVPSSEKSIVFKKRKSFCGLDVDE